MKVVACSDLHLDWHTLGFKRFDDVMERLEEVKAAALEADVFLFCGDLSDGDSPGSHRAVSAICGYVSSLACAGVTCICIAGNHDVVEDGAGTTVLSALRGLELGGAVKKLVRVFEKPAAARIEVMPETVGGKPRHLALVALPYPSRAGGYDPADFARRLKPPQEGTPLLVAGHLWIGGAPEDGGESTDLARGRGVYWPVAELERSLPGALKVGGHYHQPGWLGDVLVCGSLERLTMAEEHNQPRYLVLDWMPPGTRVPGSDRKAPRAHGGWAIGSHAVKARQLVSIRPEDVQADKVPKIEPGALVRVFHAPGQVTPWDEVEDALKRHGAAAVASLPAGPPEAVVLAEGRRDLVDEDLDPRRVVGRMVDEANVAGGEAGRERVRSIADQCMTKAGL